MKAVLMFGEMLLKIVDLPEARSNIRYMVNTMVQSLTPADDSTGPSMHDFSRQMLIFRAVRQIDFDKFEYQYDHTQSDNSFAFQMQGRVEILEEPSGKANLDFLKAKTKKGGKLKKLLSRYYNTG